MSIFFSLLHITRKQDGKKKVKTEKKINLFEDSSGIVTVLTKYHFFSVERSQF